MLKTDVAERKHQLKIRVRDTKGEEFSNYLKNTLLNSTLKLLEMYFFTWFSKG